MAIKFLRDREVEGFPVERFTKGQIVKDRDAASEMHFVRRGDAAFVGADGKLTDHVGKPVSDEDLAVTVTLDVSNNRDGQVGRAGETNLEDGAPQRGSSGPAEVVTTSLVASGDATKAGAAAGTAAAQKKKAGK